MTALRVSDRSGTLQAGRTPAAPPPLGGSNARETARRLGLTPEGSQPLDHERPHAATTLKGSQPELTLRGTVSEQGQTIVKHLGTFV